ncbi:MAG: RNA polymerase subunit sigma [Bacteroidetes bacterium GWF2_33_16]|nr:MAG: RNA polymerase subunit sigma [Bacteroidetes bacterium GWE2_32_14]OFY08877.1 MAG: RNA polymerase subunit sigma [Bacteroidetes bacterium GWF2_33_16]
MFEYSDKELLTLFRDEERKNFAFNLIVRKYQQKLYWHIRKMVIKHDDADDILQNTFIKVWKGLDGFREDSKLYTWLYRIATNESLTFLKQQKTKYLLPIADYENQLKETLESDIDFNGDEIQLKLQKAILELPEKQRIVFNMKYFDEIKYEDMSKILDTSVGALKASFHHAVKKIEKYFNEN